MPERRLTKEIAEQFLADEKAVDLSEFTEVDDDAAESLSKHKGEVYLELQRILQRADSACDVSPCKSNGLRHPVQIQ